MLLLDRCVAVSSPTLDTRYICPSGQLLLLRDYSMLSMLNHADMSRCSIASSNPRAQNHAECCFLSRVV